MQRSLSVLLLAGASVATGCNKSSKADARAASPTPIIVSAQDIAVVAARTTGAEVLVSGNLDPADVVEIKSQIAGTVSSVRVDRGSSVRRGEVLAAIEAQGVRGQAVGAEAQVAAARAQLAVAQQRLEGTKKLFAAGATSSIEYKTAQANVEAAEAQLALARANAAAAGESAARTTITAPISGVVSERAVSGGEAVPTNAALFTIVNPNELELHGQVGVAEAGRIRVGQTVTFTLDGYPNQVFRGSVARIDPTSDPTTRQVGVYVRLANPGRRIVGGQYASGRIQTGGTMTAIVIPEAAIASRQGDSATVYVVGGNRVARRSIVVGPRDEASGLLAVRSGLKAGDRVLLNPSPEIGDGALISAPADNPAGSRRD